jgi:hypothetical protein
LNVDSPRLFSPENALAKPAHEASLANSIGSTIDVPSFSDLLTRVEIGHIRIKATGNDRISSRGRGLPHRYLMGYDWAGSACRAKTSSPAF